MDQIIDIKIKSISIKNYRSCIKSLISIDNDLTCLIGINGSGKTNILNSILLLKKIIRFRNFEKDEENQSDNHTELDLNIFLNGKTIYLKCCFQLDLDENGIDLVNNVSIDWNFKDFIDLDTWISLPCVLIKSIGLLDESTSNSIDLFNTTLKSKSEKDNKRVVLSINDNRYSALVPELLKMEQIEKIINVVNSVYLFFSEINYYSASAFSDPSKCSSSLEIADNRYRRRFIYRYNHDNFIFDLYEIYKNKNDLFKIYLNLVDKSGIGLVDTIDFKEVDFPVSNIVVKSPVNIENNGKNRLFIVPNFVIDDINLSPNQLSEGTFKTLALIFYILNDNSKLLLIEEPEVCIHHGLLTSVIELIISQSKRKQIIISTHSDFVLDKLKPENIILVKKSIKNGTIAKPLTKSLSKNEFSALKKYLNNEGNLGSTGKKAVLKMNNNKGAIGIIAEDTSDVECIKIFIQKIAQNDKLSVKYFVGNGCGKIKRKAKTWAETLKDKGCNYLFLIQDLDENDFNILYQNLKNALEPSPIKNYIICIPIRELEAWLLSDTEAIKVALKLKKTPKISGFLYEIDNPKEYLRDIVYKTSENKLLYLNTTHNKLITKELSIQKVLDKNPSFSPFFEYVVNNLK